MTDPQYAPNATGFKRDLRRLQELRLRPAIDAIYSHVFEAKFIKRDSLRLDMELSIDVVLRLHNGALITGQEKALSYEYAHFESLTVEYLQNPVTGERGNWFKQIPQFYFVGYEDAQQGQFCKYILVNWFSLITARGVKWHDNHNQNGKAHSTFRYVKFADIPRHCIIATSHYF